MRGEQVGATVSVLAATKVKAIVGLAQWEWDCGGARCQWLIMPSLRGFATWHTFKKWEKGRAESGVRVGECADK